MGKKSKITRGGGGRGKAPSDSSSTGHGKPTHFLCFPIASEATIHQISASRTHWMDVTTRPVSKAPHGRRRTEIENNSGSTETILELDKGEVEAEPKVKSSLSDMGGKNEDEAMPNTERPTRATLAESLQMLPPIVTRAAGTWHLTLGVMNLADEARMKLALDVLNGLDLRRLLSDAGKGPPVGYKKARKWEDRGENDHTRSTNNEDESMTVNNNSVQPADIKKQDQSPPRLTISLTGLGGFPSLKNARVLWARPREQRSLSPTTASTNANNDHANPTRTDPDRLYNFALHIIQPFRDAGLITETRSLALHATVANMRFAKSRGRVPAWRCDRVDAARIGKVWNGYRGVVDDVDEEAMQEEVKGEGGVGARDEDEDQADDAEENNEAEGGEVSDATKEFVWVKDVDVSRVAICKLGATKHEDPLWREWYPPIEGGERLVFEEQT